MSVNWTKEQLEAINTEGSNILVAAAAGSGKTAVLVERIIRKICDKEKPVPVDRLLVLTYTEAAAAEMRRKVADAIYLKMKSEPDNKWLHDQSVLIHSANISTVHAFCKAMLQNNIHDTDLPAEFTLIDSTENEILRNKALDAVLESYYGRIEKKTGFRDLTVGYGGVKSDDSLRSTVLNLHSFVRTLAYPEKWLKEAANSYRMVKNSQSLGSTVWEQVLKNACRDLAQDVLEGYKIIRNTVENEVMSDHPYFKYFGELPGRFAEAFERVLSGTASVSEIIECNSSFKKGQARGKKDLEPELADRIEKMREELVNKPLKELKLLLGAADDDKVIRIIGCMPRVCALKQLVRQTERLHKSMKREKGALDFGDLEHEMIKLISERDGRPTAVAEKLRQRFDEILVDEYQDTNNIQDTIFRLLSRDEKNIFMVGDLKQCIYKFRNAAPDIFAKKYEAYCRGEGGICIQLFKNFRSRREVIDLANSIFDSIMTKRLGGLDYTKEEYLIQGAQYSDDAGSFIPELLITDADTDNYEPGSEFYNADSAALEALTVAKRIKKLASDRSMLITDKKTGSLRPLRYGDITILVRTTSNLAVLTSTLEEHDIPYISESGRRYLDSIEVMTVLSFLQIIDNPRQDIPLLAVLRSAIFDFSPEELAEIRLCDSSRGADFYSAVRCSAENGNKKSKEFLAVLNELRENAVTMGVDELIRKICINLGYMNLVGAMPGGGIRQANLKLLYERGTEFENGALSGLFNFMLYIEGLRESGKDMIAAKPFSDEADTVTIMTVHKSKGLEFPVVILYGTQKYFNETDESKPIIWNADAGIAMDYVDTVRRIRYSALPKLLIRDMNIHELRSEELRLLYVALTRAKEKLIISCTVSKTRNKWKEAVFDSSNRLASGFAVRRTSMRDWLLSALLNHPSCGALRELAERSDIRINNGAEFDINVTVINHDNDYAFNTMADEKTEKVQNKADDDLSYTDAAERAAYSYPHNSLTLMPVKMSVSELKRRQMPEEDYVPGIVRLNSIALAGREELGAAEIGTITHYVIQHIDLSRAESEEQIELQIKEMADSGIISQRQADAVSVCKIAEFFKSGLGRRLVNSVKAEREFDFYTELSAKELNPEIKGRDGDERILLQGIADCFFCEADGVVLIDYKTDRVSAEGAEKRAESYRLQIDCYARGLEGILGQPVKERYLYFLNCGKAIKI